MRRRTSTVDHPVYYGGAANPYEAIKVIEAWGLSFALGNTVKYIARAGKKSRGTVLEDLKKAQWYLAREIALHETTTAVSLPVDLVLARPVDKEDF